MGSIAGRRNANWNTPAGWMIKACAKRLALPPYNLSGERLVSRLLGTFSMDTIKAVVGNPELTRNAIACRATIAFNKNNRSEWPDIHPVGRLYWPHTEETLHHVFIDAKDLNKFLATMNSEEPVQLDNPEKEISNSVSAGFIYIYAAGSRCVFGRTKHEDPDKRKKNYEKGDTHGQLELRFQVWVAEIGRIDTLLKRKFDEAHIGSERYRVPAESVYPWIKVFCERETIPSIVVVDSGYPVRKEAAE